jgi:hypothetical protein
MKRIHSIKVFHAVPGSIHLGKNWRCTAMTERNSSAVDLGAVFDAHVKAEFVFKDVAAMS